MEEEICEKIIKSLNSVISIDQQIDEFDIVQSLGDENKSPVIHTNHKLGLKSWCVKYIYKYAYAKIFQLIAYNGHKYYHEIENLTQVVLLITPEVSTFWNTRKRLIKKNLLKLKDDLFLSKLVLTRKPKSLETFQHRRWLLSHYISQKKISDDAFGNGLEDEYSQYLRLELLLCNFTASKACNNYHAWNHKIWVFEKLMLYDDFNLMAVEWESNKEWINSHTSEHSGMHYRTFILEQIAKFCKVDFNIQSLNRNCTNMSDLFLWELSQNKEIIKMFMVHESLFYYRKYLISKLYEIYCVRSNLVTSSAPPALKRSCIETTKPEWPKIITEEYGLKNLLINNSHFNYLCERYIKFITYNFKL